MSFSSAVISAEQQLRTVDFRTAANIALVADFSDMNMARIPSGYADDMKFMKYFYPDFSVRLPRAALRTTLRY